eukprot:CAMPEP_0119015940 /NCGR_PEP_ID=MMETSP1176-20130426/11730_1 /TAXON_ID=265551 /ORGANISM="Synedropsis recta cf, Strain CCMP1620" /LENGTH=469 /DNA_ID=CAMNT_0006969265 /DNA_START=219 /DNA_END=1628 /DNA_ORIENTATION=-
MTNVTTNATAAATNVTLAPLDDDAAMLASNNLLATILSNAFLFLLIFGLSATVSIDSLRHQLGNRFALLTGVGMQFIIMPLLGFLSVMMLKNGDGFTQAMGITLLVVTSSPGGSYSNWWCSLFNAELSLSVAMTAFSTILSVGMLPANLLLYSYLAYGNDDDSNIVAALDFGTLFISLGIVMGGIVLGLFCSYKIQSPVFRKWCHRAANISGIALILVSVLLSSVGVETNFWNQPWEFYVGVAFPCLVGLTLANVLARSCRLQKPECVAISIECCYQNTGIATSVAVTMFTNPEIRAQAVAVPLFYGLVEALVIGIYCVWAWKAGWTKAPATEKLCIVVSNTYEGQDDDDDKEEDDDDLEVGSRSNDDDLNVIHEESAPRWFQFWKKRQERTEAVGHVTKPQSSKMEQGGCSDINATCGATNRNRLVSEDNTVVTEVSTARSRLASEDSVAPAATTVPSKEEDNDEEQC